MRPAVAFSHYVPSLLSLSPLFGPNAGTIPERNLCRRSYALVCLTVRLILEVMLLILLGG